MECIVLILLILATFLRVTAFRGGHSPTPTFFQNRLKFRGGAYIFGRSVTHAMKASESEYDNYDDFLNLDKPIGGDSKKVELTKQEVSILPPKICSESGEIVVDADGKNMLPPPRKFRGFKEETGIAESQRKWPNWDKFMEEHLGDLDEDISEDDNWMWEARNAVEAKRGFAIWSKRSPKEIEKEVQKSVAAKTLGVPRSVATIICAVHMERSHTMKLIRKENELAAIEFRKWVIERKQKQKKDPLPMARVEVSKSWLTKHPTSNMISYSMGSGNDSPSDYSSLARSTHEINPDLAPFSSNTGSALGDFISLKGKIIMDDCSVAIRGASFSGSSGLGEGKNVKASKNTHKAMMSSSMKLWDKEESDMPAPRPTASQLAAQKATSASDSFTVDGEEMFLASQRSDEYFVVM